MMFITLCMFIFLGLVAAGLHRAHKARVAPQPQPQPVKGPIKHVIIIMRENQGFHKMFGGMSGIHPNMRGVDLSKGLWSNKFEKFFYPREVTEVRVPNFGPEHSVEDTAIQMNLGKMDGFLKNFEQRYPKCTEEDLQHLMDYFAYGALPASHVLATHFQMFDNWRASAPGPTWLNRFFALLGSSYGLANMTAGFFNRMKWLKVDAPSVFDKLKEAGRSFVILYHDLPICLTIKSIRAFAIASHMRQISWLKEACAGREADFPDVVYIEPMWYGPEGNSDLGRTTSCEARSCLPTS